MTGANYMLESGGEKILIDCGLRQGANAYEKENFDPFSYDPKEISAVFITHAHVDHTGLLPKLVKHGFKGKVYSVEPTRDFAELLLIDSDHILVQEAEKLGKPVLYDMRDIEDLMQKWEGVAYHEQINLKNFKITFRNAGHILGSASILIEGEGKKIIFSGDLGNSPAPIIGNKEFPPTDIDYCLIESAYGNRFHEDIPKRKEELRKAIMETVRAGGVLMIPAFAMERTQDLLSELNDLAESGMIPRVPIYLDSPLAIKLTRVYSTYADYWDEKSLAKLQKGDALFSFPGLKMTLTTDESKIINEVPAPKVIIAGSGMSTAGRILHHEKRYLSDKKSALLIIGYQAVGSLGRKILEGAKMVRLLGEEVAVNCRIINVPAYSAHADQPQLLEWLKPMKGKLKKIFVVQGDEGMGEFAAKIKETLGVEAEVPEPLSTFEL